MKKSPLTQDTLREIKKTRGQFISVLLMIALASLIYFGITIASPSMKATTKDLMLASHFSDLDLVAQAGFGPEDLEKIDQLEGVRQREDFYRADLEDGEGRLIRLENQAERLGLVQVREGRLVQEPGEIVLDRDAQALGYELGDRIHFPDTSDALAPFPLARQDFTLVGFVDSLDYVVVDQKGYSTQEASSLDLLGRIHPQDFDLDRVQRVALAFRGLEGLTIADEAYAEKIRPYEDQVRALFANYSQTHYQEIQEDLAQEIREGEGDLAQARADLQEAQAQVDQAKEDLAQARDKFNQGRADYESRIRQAQETLAANQAKLSQAQKDLEAGQARLAQAKKDLGQGQKDYQEGQAQVREKEAQLAQGQDQLRAAEKDLEKKRQDLEAGQDQLAQARQEVQAGQDQLGQARAQLADQDEKLQAGWAQIQAGRAQLAQGEGDLAQAQAQLEAGRAQVQAYDQGGQEAQAGLAQVQAGLGQVEEQANKLQGQIQELQAQLGNLQAQKTALDQQIQSLQGQLAQAETEEDKLELQAQLQQALEKQAQVTAEIQGLETGLAQAQTGLAQAQAQEAQLQAQKTQLEGVLAQLASQQDQIDQARKDLEKGQRDLDQGRRDLEANRQQLAAEEDRLQAGQAQLDQARTQLQAEEARLAQGQRDLEEEAGQLQAGEEKLQAGEEKLAQEKARLQAGQTQLDQAREDLAQAQADLQRGQESYQQGLADLEEGQRDLQAGRKQWAAGRQDLAQARAQGQEDLDQAQADLEAGERELRDQEDQFLAEKDQALDQIGEGEEALADLRNFKSRLPQPLLEINSQRNSPHMGAFLESISRLPIIGYIFPTLFFLIALMVSLTTMTRRIESNRNQLGILKALGYEAQQIASKYLVYSGLASLLGAGLGILLGYSIIAPTIIQAYLAASTIDNYRLVFSWPAALFLTLLTLTMTSLVSGLLLVRSLQARPALLLRPKAPKAGSRILLERVPFLWKRLNFNQKVAARNLFRYKRRAFMTILGIGGCAALLFLGFAIKDSIRLVGPRQYEDLFHFQYLVNYNDKDQSDQRQAYEDLLAQPSISQHHGLRLDQATVANPKNMDQKLLVLATADPAGLTDLIHLVDRQTQQELVLDRALVTEKLAQVFDLEPGDLLAFETAQGQEVQVEIGGITENYAQHFLYLPASVYEACFHQDFVENADLVQTQDPQVIQEIKDLDLVFTVLDIADFNSFLDEVSGSLNILVLVIILCSIALAFVVLYNLNTINIQERQRELSTIKVLGFYDREVTAYIYRETILLSLLGILLGFGLGRAMHLLVLNRLMPDSLMLYPGVFWPTFAWTFIILAAFLLVVMAIIHRRLKRINMVQALKEE